MFRYIYIQWSPYIRPLSPFINVFNLPLTSGHPSYTAAIFIPQGWPHTRGPLYIYMDIYRDTYRTKRSGPLTIPNVPFVRICMVISKLFHGLRATLHALNVVLLTAICQSASCIYSVDCKLVPSRADFFIGARKV